MTANLPIEPEAEDILGNQLLIPHVVEHRIDAIDGDGWISKTKNTFDTKNFQMSIESLVIPTVEFRCYEDDARLFGSFSEALILDFSITDLNPKMHWFDYSRDILTHRDGINTQISFE